MTKHTATPWFKSGDTRGIIKAGVRFGEFDRAVDADRAIACVNACEGLNPEGYKAVVEAIIKQMPLLITLRWKLHDRQISFFGIPKDSLEKAINELHDALSLARKES